MAVARLVRVHGHVQGVFFRDSTRAEARERGIAGWVRNRSDGSVEAWLEGDEDAVRAMIAWAEHGPSRASVQHVEAVEVDPEGLSDFEVR